MSLPGRQREWHFQIEGLDCAEEVAVLTRELGPLVGGQNHLSFDVLRGRLTVMSTDAGISSDDLCRAVARTGMRAVPWRDQPPQRGSSDYWRGHVRAWLTVASGCCVALGVGTHAIVAGSITAALGAEGSEIAGPVPLPARACYSLGILLAVWHVLPKAWLAIRRLRPDMNLLMSVAIAGAIGIGQWFEAATVAFLFALSLTLESWSVGRARHAVAALMDLTPPAARRLSADGREEQVSPDQLSVGERLVVRPGERIALDGRVLRGASEVNQAPITGESVPVAKGAGDEVFAGTINGDGALVVECTRRASDTTLAHIIRLVGEAQARRAPSEQWVEKFARVYTPAVMSLALAVFVVPPAFFAEPWSDWLYRALVLLVIACPCALVISTPVSIVAAQTAAARNGVLIKGGLYLELPAKLRAVAFDKTGTLTEGRPSVVEIVPLSGHDERELLERGAALSTHSTHPLARAVVNLARRQGVPVDSPEHYHVLQGRGAVARIKGQEYWIGSHRYLEERGQETAEVHRRLEELSAEGRSVMVVGNSQHVCGIVALADAPRAEANRVIADLRRAGVRHLVMLTGDNAGTAGAVARETGVDEVRAELLPEDKVAAVEELVAKFGVVAMVGDGVNDAPAMGRATIGVAMGAAGSDAAIETADIALMSDDLAKLPWLIGHSRRTLAIVRQNIGFALSIKALFVLLSLLGHASLWSAIAADMGASLVVIFNGLRLLRWER